MSNKKKARWYANYLTSNHAQGEKQWGIATI